MSARWPRSLIAADPDGKIAPATGLIARGLVLQGAVNSNLQQDPLRAAKVLAILRRRHGVVPHPLLNALRLLHLDRGQQSLLHRASSPPASSRAISRTMITRWYKGTRRLRGTRRLQGPSATPPDLRRARRRGAQAPPAVRGP